MSIELNGQNDIVRRNGNLPDEVVATKAGPSLTAAEVAYLESLPPQSSLKQAYLASNAKTELQGYQVPAVQALVSTDGNRTLAAVGDSFTAQGYFANATETTRYAKNWVEWALSLSNHRLSLISQNAVGGSRVTGDGTGVAFATQMQSAIASGASDILIMGGVNDIINAVPLATIMEQYGALIDAATDAGRRLWVATQPGMNSAFASYSAGKQQALMTLNRWLRDRVQAANPRVHVVDVAGGATDGASATGNWRTNGSQDNLHPRNVGAYWMGKALAAAWSAELPAWDRRQTSNADCYTFNAASRQGLDNPLFVAGAGTATNWTLSYTGSGAGTASQVDRADGFGKDQTIALTAGADGDAATLVSDNVYSKGFAAGDVVVLEAEVTFSAGPVNIRNVRAICTQNGTIFITATALALDSTPANDTALPEAFTAVLRTPPMTLVAGQTFLTATLRATFSGNPTGTTIKWGRASLRRLYGAY